MFVKRQTRVTFVEFLMTVFLIVIRKKTLFINCITNYMAKLHARNLQNYKLYELSNSTNLRKKLEKNETNNVFFT